MGCKGTIFIPKSHKFIRKSKKITICTDSLTFINKRAVCVHNLPLSHCRTKKSPYLCTVKRNKKPCDTG